MLTGGGVKIPLEGWMPMQKWEGEVVDLTAYDYDGYVIVNCEATKYTWIQSTTSNLTEAIIALTDFIRSNNYYYGTINDYNTVGSALVSNWQLYGYINGTKKTIAQSNQNQVYVPLNIINNPSNRTALLHTYLGSSNPNPNQDLVIKASTAYIDTPSGRIWFTDWAEANGIDLNFYET